MSESELLNRLRNAVIVGNIGEAERLAKQVVAEGVDPLRAFDEGLREGITEVGDGFASGEYFLPDLVISAEAMKAASVVLEQEIARTGVVRARVGKVVMGTVEGDLHDIGKTIVGTLLASHGFEVVDLGVNVSTQAFLAAVRDHQPQILGMSSLLTITAKELRKVIDALREAGIRDTVKVMIGGGAVTQGFSDSIGADGFAHDAELAVRVAKRLMDAEG
jgi:5-methyltetrahydrofolate--homocysteine methyltransferase